VKRLPPRTELYHEIFGSILDRTEMVPYLLLRSATYEQALERVTLMLANRGFDTASSPKLRASEEHRAQAYIRRALMYFHGWLLPFIELQLTALLPLSTRNRQLYDSSLTALRQVQELLRTPKLRALIEEDPRHLFLLASSRRFPHLFTGRSDVPHPIPPCWQLAACATLKMCHLIKSIEEDSQDVNDYAQLGLFLVSQSVSLDDLSHFRWRHPELIPSDEPAQKAFVKLSTFFHKVDESMRFDKRKKCLVFNSGDGVEVDIMDLKARLKSPESMFTKLGKDLEGEAHDIRDILAVTFILRSKDDTLKLFHALQKRGVILQENVISHSITQTLFEAPSAMLEAVRRLQVGLGHSSGKRQRTTRAVLLRDTNDFFEALTANASSNKHSSLGHRKFQCKLNFSVPIHRDAATRRILIPGTREYATRDKIRKETQQHTLAVELRISDAQSWQDSEQKGDAHHDAYKFRQVVSLTARLFGSLFQFPDSATTELRRDQRKLFE
jgi:uncharacterized protein (TIGR04562 family)